MWDRRVWEERDRRKQQSHVQTDGRWERRHCSSFPQWESVHLWGPQPQIWAGAAHPVPTTKKSCCDLAQIKGGARPYSSTQRGTQRLGIRESHINGLQHIKTPLGLDNTSFMDSPDYENKLIYINRFFLMCERSGAGTLRKPFWKCWTADCSKILPPLDFFSPQNSDLQIFLLTIDPILQHSVILRENEC